MFIIGGLGYIIPAIIFWIFGTAEIQEWNDIAKLIDVEEQPESQGHEGPQQSEHPDEIQQPQKPRQSLEQNGTHETQIPQAIDQTHETEADSAEDKHTKF